MKNRTIKQTEAKARQEAYDKLSLSEKIERAKSRRGEKEKELSRLLWLKMESSKNKQE